MGFIIGACQRGTAPDFGEIRRAIGYSNGGPVMTFGDFGTVTRRATLSLLSVLAPASGWLVASEADARKHRRKKQCKKNCGICRKCKNGKCKTTAGASCGTGGNCLANRTCANTCDPAAQDCPTNCYCVGPTVEGRFHCVSYDLTSCSQFPQTCATSADCPLGSFCKSTLCGPGTTAENRCVPLCSA